MKTSPKTAIILGTGLGQLASEITDTYEFPYSEIPHFPVSTVEGHSGKLIFGKLGGKDIMAMQGRFHFYEGYSMKEVTFPIRVMYELGIQTLFVSNAAGGMNPAFKVGDLMIITDHINFFPEHPLHGPNFPTGPRFPDMHETYDHQLIELADQIAEEKNIKVAETDSLLRYSGGDARKLLNIIELVVESQESESEIVVNDSVVTEALQQNPLAYDKDGEMHYDIISAFIKSIRGSNPDAAIYYLARMIEGGEDPLFIARRLVISASEDIGLANPNALLLANAAFDAVNKIGMPEGRIPLAEATVYLATSAKSNSAYMAVNSALQYVESTGNLAVPLHLRNAPTKLMEQLGYAKGYKYAHDYAEHFVRQQFLPDEAEGQQFWKAQDNPQENRMRELQEHRWGTPSDKNKEI